MILGIGNDITEVSRLRRAVEKWGDEFLNRVFTKDELANDKRIIPRTTCKARVPSKKSMI